MSTGPGMVIVGGGECGARAALALRERGFAGTIDLIGDEPHPPYERPPLSKAVFAEGAEPVLVAGRERLAAQGIVHHAGVRAEAIERDRHRLRLADGTEIAYAKLLLATGARPRRIVVDGVEPPGISYLRTLGDCRALRAEIGPGRRVLILGAGFLGLEIAAAAVLRGAAVTVIEAQARVLMRGVPEPVARIVEARHREAGVTLLCGTPVASVAATGGSACVTLADGRVIEGDIVLASVGAVPNVDLAKTAGLTIENGILVDRFLTTGDPDILAAGDCCAFPRGGRPVRLEAWRNAVDQAAIAAANMLGAALPYEAVPWFWSDQYDLTLQVAGLPDPGDEVVRRDLGGGAFVLFHLDQGGRLVAASGIGVGGAVARDIRLAEMLIARNGAPDRVALADPAVKLKSLLSR